MSTDNTAPPPASSDDDALWVVGGPQTDTSAFLPAPPPALSGEVGEMTRFNLVEDKDGYGLMYPEEDGRWVPYHEAADLLARVAAERDDYQRLCEAKANMKRDLGRAEARADVAESALVKAREALRIWDEAFATGRSEPLYIARDAARAALAAMEAGDGKR